MDPTLNREKCFLLVKVGLLFYPFKLCRGEVILSSNPRNPDDQDVVKRIIGMEDDIIIKHPRGWKSRSPHLLSFETIKPGHLWLQGDNMRESCDSRTYGQVDVSKVYGKVMCQLWPDFKFMRNTMEYSGQGKEFQDIIALKSKSEALQNDAYTPHHPIDPLVS